MVILQGKYKSFQASFLLVYLLTLCWLFMFSQRCVQLRARLHLLWKWRRYNEMRGGGKVRQCTFIDTSYRAILHFLSLQQSSPTFSLFTRGIQPLPAVFHSSHPLLLDPFLSLLTFSERTIPPVHSSIEQITFWVALSSRNSSHPHPFFPLFRAHIPVPSRIWMDIDHY